MTWLKRNIIGSILVAILYAASYFFTSHHTATKPTTSQVLGAQTNLSLFEQPGTGRQPILDAINGAQQQVLIEVYELTDKQIIAALTQAKARGVDVKVMLEQHPFGSETINDRTKQTLANANIPVEWTNPAFALTHEKDMIIDGRRLFVLNQNLTTSSFSKNREYDIIDDDLTDIQEAGKIFSSDWYRSGFSPTDSHLVVSPDNARAALTALLQSATKSIVIEIEDINDPMIVDLLASKTKTMQVRILTPTVKQVASNKDALTKLQNAGVQVKTISSPYIHAKLILADDQKAYIGSVNLSTQSLDKNRELGIILSKSEVTQTLETDFENDWQLGKDL